MRVKSAGKGAIPVHLLAAMPVCQPTGEVYLWKGKHKQRRARRPRALPALKAETLAPHPEHQERFKEDWGSQVRPRPADSIEVGRAVENCKKIDFSGKETRAGNLRREPRPWLFTNEWSGAIPASGDREMGHVVHITGHLGTQKLGVLRCKVNTHHCTRYRFSAVEGEN